jgi:phosphoglycerol transferase MdoB-like AlkP superfamily enzyme
LLPLAAFLLVALAMLTTSRALLVAWQWERVSAVQGLWPVLGIGLRMDSALLCYLLIVPAALVLILPQGGRIGEARRRLLVGWLALVAAALVFMELATPPYIDQYGVRPSRTFLEYLIYPREVFSTLWAAYRLPMLLASALFAATIVLAWRLGNRAARAATPWRPRRRALALPLVLIVMALGARSSLQHRPANASTAAFSPDPMVNDLALNSAYTTLYAAYALGRESDPTAFYGRMPDEEVLARIRAAMVTEFGGAFRDDSIPTLHRQRAAGRPARPPNLVIILEESLGAQFVGALGGPPLTPELDRLSREGWWLEQLYATGTRSARGLEAVAAGFPPTPAQAVLKLGKAQDGFYTLARTLAARGYATEFIYGGEGHFDNMAGFFLRNGFHRFIAQHDYARPLFRGSWGVSDEDLFERAHQEFLAHHDKPFFALVFSSSFHSPFEFPDGRIELHGESKSTPHNAVKYADYALGQFFRKAKQAPYWEHTLFLVVADHDARVFGASLVPIERFHIPGLILGKSIAPRRYAKPASQIDLAPTLLSLMGIESEHPMIGHDLTRLPVEFPGRALMQYENNHAYLKGARVVIHEPHKPPRHFRNEAGRLRPAEAPDHELEREALAHALWPSLAYRQTSYRLGGSEMKRPEGLRQRGVW